MPARGESETDRGCLSILTPRSLCIIPPGYGDADDRIWLPSVSRGAGFPPVDGALVLAAVKQTALDCGCGSALGQGVGNAANKGLGRR